MVLGNLIDLLDAALLNDEEAIWKRLLNLKEIYLWNSSSFYLPYPY